MTVEQQTVAPDWQTALDPQLVQRLARPLVSPGVIDRGRITTVRAPADHAISRSALMTELAQRHSSVERAPGNQPLIVLAQRLPRGDAGEATPPAAARELPRVSAQPLPAAARLAPASTPQPVTLARRIDPAQPADRPIVSGAPRGDGPASTRVVVAPLVTPGSASPTIARTAAPYPAAPRLAGASPLVPASAAPAPQRVSAAAPGAPAIVARVPAPTVASASPDVARVVVAPLTAETRRVSAAPAPVAHAATRPTGTVVQRVVEGGVMRSTPSAQPAVLVRSSSASQAIQRSADMPVVAARSVTGAESSGTISRAIDSSVGGEMPIDSSVGPASSTSEQHTTTTHEQPLDTDALVETVLRKLSRQLAVEQERRGVQRWP